MAPRAKKSASTKRSAKKPAKRSASKARRRKPAAKASARKSPTAAQRAQVRKSYNDVKKAQKNLELKMRKHTQMVSSMFFAI